jgi:hypothetical protein
VGNKKTNFLPLLLVTGRGRFELAGKSDCASAAMGAGRSFTPGANGRRNEWRHAKQAKGNRYSRDIMLSAAGASFNSYPENN